MCRSVGKRSESASVQKEAEAFGATADQEQINKIAEERLRDEIRRGVQTIQYQVVTLLTTNGQAPFVTVFMYLGEAKIPRKRPTWP